MRIAIYSILIYCALGCSARETTREIARTLHVVLPDGIPDASIEHVQVELNRVNVQMIGDSRLIDGELQDCSACSFLDARRASEPGAVVVLFADSYEGHPAARAVSNLDYGVIFLIVPNMDTSAEGFADTLLHEIGHHLGIPRNVTRLDTDGVHCTESGCVMSRDLHAHTLPRPYGPLCTLEITDDD